LDFRMNEARPSPSYHVKFIVVCRSSVYEGKCFSRRVRMLQTGDIVTANQERGDKVRIIKYCPRGSEVEHQLKGWVLLRTKEKELLRRIELVDGKIVTKERRFSFNKKQHIEPIISPECTSFRVQNYVTVYGGILEPSSVVIGRLSPGDIVHGDKMKGSMLRIIKLDHKSKPHFYGWVMPQLDGKRQFEFMPSRQNSERSSVHTASTAEELNSCNDTRTSSEESSTSEVMSVAP